MKLPEKKGLLKIYFHIAENSGVGLYRQFQIASALMNQNKANVLINDFTWGETRYRLTDRATGKNKVFDTKIDALSAMQKREFPLQELEEVGMVEPDMDTVFEIANWADIMVVGRRDMPNYLATWGGIKEFFNVPIVMDTDDNVRFVRPSNPGYASYGANAEAIQWDKYAFKKTFDAITVSTQNLKDYHSPEHPKIEVVPNAIDFRVWDPPSQPLDDGKIRVCFNGSSSHWEGARIIEKPVVQILKDFPNVLFYIPLVYRNIFDEYPDLKAQIVYFPWVPLKNFAQGMRDLHIDIGLAPLTDSMFNRAKSNLRWLEYSALKIPTVVSPVEAYANVTHNKTALVALEKSEWYDSIKALILDKELRRTLAENAYAEVREKYNIEKNAEKVLPFYEDVVKKYHALLGPKKRFEKVKGGWKKV